MKSDLKVGDTVYIIVEKYKVIKVIVKEAEADMLIWLNDRKGNTYCRSNVSNKGGFNSLVYKTKLEATKDMKEGLEQDIKDLSKRINSQKKYLKELKDYRDSFKVDLT